LVLAGKVKVALVSLENSSLLAFLQLLEDLENARIGPRRDEVRIVFMGTPEFAVPSLEELVLDGHQVAAVYTQPDRPAGRGLKPSPPPAKRAAIRLGLPVLQPASLKTAAAAGELADLKPEAIVVAAYGQILPPAVLEIPGFGTVNVHPSLLPRHRGASPVAAAILAGDGFCGVSIMLLDAGLDTGPVLTRAQIPISAGDTTGSLEGKLALLGASLLAEVLANWPGGLQPRPQDEAGATYSGTIAKETGKIDWRQPAVTIWRQVRAYQPRPGAYTSWQGKRLKILATAPLQEASTARPGQVVDLRPSRKAAFAVATGEGLLGVIRLQLEGKQPMAAAEFRRGQRQLVGAVLASA
jgi:methionyl-tRNA formyltransferase